MKLTTNEKLKWSPVTGEIMTRWVKKVSPNNPHPEYPRPQLVRNEWLNLNGLWEYAICPKQQESIQTFDGKILVPFPVESALSGVKKKLRPKDRLWYRRHFKMPDAWNDDKILLHFGAVDWETTVWVNGVEVGSHKGGYTPFSFNISNEIHKSGENELVVAVWDPTGKGMQEHGKQTLRPKLIYYTAVSGIWQTAWIEPIPPSHIKKLVMVPDIDKEILNLQVIGGEIHPEDQIHAVINEKGSEILSLNGKSDELISLKIPNPKHWSPGSPFLYDLDVKLERKGQVLDEVASYFGMRKIALKTDGSGHVRIELNNIPIFQYGTLDQGYWPDGLYTAPTDEALLYDIEITKDMGFNMIRKHGKVEPLRWYYHCDRLGMLVWQDMPSGGWLIVGRWKKSVRRNYHNELESMISTLYNSPSIIVWVPFNEGWGQFDTKNVVQKIKTLDPSRLIDHASGWFDKGIGDIRDIHNYPNPKMPKRLKGRAAVIGEFGGLGMKVEGHMWRYRFKHAYDMSKNGEEMVEKYAEMMTMLHSMIKEGLCGAIYTQITDIEREINGLLTYDRDIIKMDMKRLKEMHNSLYQTLSELISLQG